MAQFKQKCMRCRKNYVLVSHKTRFTICYDCQKPEMEGRITNPKMKKMFNIPEELYRQSSFLRSIKVNYLLYRNLTETQIKAFKKAVKDMKEEKK